MFLEATKEYEMTFYQNMNEQAPETAEEFPKSAWGNIGIAEQMDSEMAASLRMHLHAAFASATGWGDLSEKLRRRGFYLRAAKSRLWLCDCKTRNAICSCRFLGFPSQQLSTRFGTGG